MKTVQKRQAVRIEIANLGGGVTSAIKIFVTLLVSVKGSIVNMALVPVNAFTPIGWAVDRSSSAAVRVWASFLDQQVSKRTGCKPP